MGSFDPGGHGHFGSTPISASVHLKAGGGGGAHCGSLEPAKHGHRGSLPTKASVHSKPGGGGAHRGTLEPGVHGHRGSIPTKSSVHRNLGSGVVGGGRYVRDSGVVVVITGFGVVVVTTFVVVVVKILGWVVILGVVVIFGVVVMTGRVVVGSGPHVLVAGQIAHFSQDGQGVLAGQVVSTGLAHSFFSHFNETSQRPSSSPRKSSALLIGFGLLTNSFVAISFATTFESTCET